MAAVALHFRNVAPGIDEHILYNSEESDSSTHRQMESKNYSNKILDGLNELRKQVECSY